MGETEDLWLRARYAQFTLLIPTCLFLLLSCAALVPHEWAIYTMFVLNWLGVTALFSYAIAFIPIVCVSSPNICFAETSGANLIQYG